MPYADLHVHTTRSDGQLTLEEIPQAAIDSGVRVVAVTDHDRLQPFTDRSIIHDGITILHGIELRVTTNEEHQIDLLGLGIEPTQELEDLCTKLQQSRQERAKAIISLIEQREGIELDIPINPGIGRPHIARAVANHPELNLKYQGVFDTLIGTECPCYVPRDIPSFEVGKSVLRTAASVISLAHPFRYESHKIVQKYSRKLGAVERYYPYSTEPDTTALDEVITQYGLLETGGSDAHGKTIGMDGLSKEQYRQLDLAT